MATVQIEGTVTGAFAKGIRVTEQDGDYTRRWTVWTTERPAEGTIVTITGRLGTKTEPGRGQHEGKTFIEHHVNEPTITVTGDTGTRPAPAGPTPAATSPADYWAQTSADTPF